MLKELVLWTVVGAFVLGTSAQNVTKDENGMLIFPPIPQTCEYKLTDQLSQATKSAAFGNIATRVIHVIARKPFADYVGIVKDTIQDPSNVELSQYGTFFAGITILFILGLLLAIIVPCVGLIFCCCRCCDNCGGKKLQKTEDNTLCRHWSFVSCLVVVSLLLGVGCASVYLGGATLVSSPETIADTVLKTADDLQCYLAESFTKEFEFLVDISTTGVVNLVQGEFNEITGAANTLLQEADEVVDKVKRLDEIAKRINSSLNQVADIQNAEETLKMNLDTFVNDYNATLNSAECTAVAECRLARDNFNSASFSVNSDVVNEADLDSVRNTLTDILAQDLTGKAEELQSQLAPVREFIDTNSFDFDSSDFNSELTDGFSSIFTDTFEEVRSTLNDPLVTDALGMASQYGFICAAVLAALIGIVVVFYILGIIFGEIGRDSDDEPTERHCMANCGGCMLVFGWVFSLLFYFLIAILAATFFLFGSVGEKFICQPLSEPGIADMILELIPNEFLENSTFDLSSVKFEAALRSCEENDGIWSALNLDILLGAEFDDVFSSLEDALNTTSLLEGFNFDESLDFDVGNLDNLTNLDFSVINFTTLQAELDKPFPSLDPEISNIMNLSGLVGSPSLRQQLEMHAANLQQIQDENLQPLQDKVDNLSADLPGLEQNITELKDNASQLATDVEQLLEIANATLQDVEELIPTVADYVSQTLDHVKMEVKTNVGKCRPLYNLYDSLDYMLCDNIFDSMNSIWLGFGIAVIFFIFGVIFAVKLSKFYRRMLYRDDNQNYAQEHFYDNPRAGVDGYEEKNFAI